MLSIKPLCRLDDGQAVTSSTSHDHDVDTATPSPIFDIPFATYNEPLTPSPVFDDQDTSPTYVRQ